MGKALILGVSASFFFAFTYTLNQQISISGGSWLWSSSLRFIFMLPILFIIVVVKKQLRDVLHHIIKNPLQWVTWSTIGFGLFYGPICFASAYGPSWLVSGTFQLTIIAGALMSPLFFKEIETEDGILKVRNKIPKKALSMSLIILSGIFLMQLEQAKGITGIETLLGLVPVIVAAFAYPLGNRKMMEICGDNLNTLQRVFGMTLCSMPLWIIISICGVLTVGIPSKSQIVQSLIIAVFAGIIATILFFKATDLVSPDTNKLAIVESTQSGAVIFTLLGGILIFNHEIPTIIGIVGILLVVTGMILNSLIKS